MSRKGLFHHPLPSYTAQSTDSNGRSKMLNLIISKILQLKSYLVLPLLKILHTAIVVLLFKMWSISNCVQCLLRKCNLKRRCKKICKQTKMALHYHQNHFEDRRVLLHDVRDSIYVRSSSINLSGWSMITLIMRDWLYLKFCPLNQGLLSLRAKSCVGVRNKN